MARFQATTNAVLDEELDMLRERLGLEASQKADLLREVASIATWVIQQAMQGRVVVARRGDEIEPLVHPAIERIRAQQERPHGERIALSDAEVARLAEVLDRGFDPPPALRSALANLASTKRRAPRLRWKKTAA